MASAITVAVDRMDSGGLCHDNADRVSGKIREARISATRKKDRKTVFLIENPGLYWYITNRTLRISTLTEGMIKNLFLKIQFD